MPSFHDVGHLIEEHRTVTWALILLISGFHGFKTVLNDNSARFIRNLCCWGPIMWWNMGGFVGINIYSMIDNSLVHRDFYHLLGNMIYLRRSGHYLENALGTYVSHCACTLVSLYYQY